MTERITVTTHVMSVLGQEVKLNLLQILPSLENYFAFKVTEKFIINKVETIAISQPLTQR